MISFILAACLVTQPKEELEIHEVDVRTFHLPNNLPRRYVIEIKSINLYVSTNEGKSWRLYNTFPSTTDEFYFTTLADGTYWYAVQYVRYTGEVHPKTTDDLKVDLKVKIDTGFKVRPASDVLPAVTTTPSSSTNQVQNVQEVQRVKYRRIKFRRR